MSGSAPAARGSTCGADLDDAGAANAGGKHAERAPSQGEQHGVGGHGGVPDEGRFLARIEEAQPNIVIRGRSRRTRRRPRRARIRARRRAGWHRSVRPRRGRTVAGLPVKRVRGECVYLKNAQGQSPQPMAGVLHASAPSGYTSVNLGVVLERPETREIECSIDLRTR